MPEVADAGEDHGYAQPVGGGDYVLILDAAAGLDHGRRARFCNGFKTVRKREEGVRGGDAARKREYGFHRAEPRRIHAAHLACANAECLAVFGVDNSVGLDVLGDAPGEEQTAQLLGGGRTPGDNVQLRLSDTAGVGVLQEQPA